MSEKELICPSCGPGTKIITGAGGKFTCEGCGGTFQYEAGEAKLKDVGQLDRLTQDVEELKAQVKAGRQAPTEDPDTEMPPRDPDERVDVGDEEDDDDEDL